MPDLIEDLSAVFGQPRYNDGSIAIFSASEPDEDEEEEDDDSDEDDEDEDEDD